MKYSTESAGGTVEILVGLTTMHTTTPIKVATPTGDDAGTIVKAGTPLTAAGASTTGSGAVGILLYDVDTEANPNGTIVQSGPIDAKKAQEHSGVTYADALYTALPAVTFRTDIGANT